MLFDFFVCYMKVVFNIIRGIGLKKTYDFLFVFSHIIKGSGWVKDVI